VPGTAFDPETATPAELEGEASYQHAVLTAALGDKPAAAKEYLALIQEFPESEQAAKAIRRLAAMHRGKLLPAEQKVWEAAQRTARDREHTRMRANAMCGPEVVAELLRRKETPVPVAELAKEMGTDEFGTSVKALQQSLAKRGLKAKGLRLTLPALWNKRLPAVALLKQGHFVLVDRIAEGTVETWDPDAGESGAAAARRYTWPEFEGAWTGTALVFE
jgi:predicted double-glycine peptidase